MKSLARLLFMFFLCASISVNAQRNEKSSDKNEHNIYSSLKVRNIGPAFVSGRIADIAIHPDNENVWYVAVGSGGVWKTSNNGITWQSIFDKQSVYSTGCITLDPNDPNIVWLGTGENVGGRHVGFGDGVYRSKDGGKSWQNMGLKNSQHISEIIVHPSDSDVIWVAAQGPLWNKGDQRGLYKSKDGGKTWKKTLGDAEWVGVTDIELDPRNPDWMYAATWQRHRTVAAYMGGGPGSGMHRSKDGGETWEKLTSGIPKSNLGKIGFCISPQNPDVIYAAIELDRTKGGVFKSENRGSTWSKMSDAVSGGTGPHYYQELYASPHKEGRLYLMDVRVQLSEDGGKTFNRLSERNKHSDNHAIAFRASDPDYLLIGTDAGLYESFDNAQNWRLINNMPITQYYKVAVDDRKPFYHVFGGTQDNGSHGGPSQTDNEHGIRNDDWYKTLYADGHQSATEPGNPDIIYAETQQGGLHRIDLKTGEPLLVQPQARAGEPFERYNWDAPIVVSPHNPARLYFASHRVWKSDTRGDSWTPISSDLTRNQERITLPIMGGQQSWDNPWDVGAMSNYNSITSLSESPLKAGLIYAGTDDGLIQVTENDGENWRKIEANKLPGLPKTAFCNDIKADIHDENVVYAAFDNHKYGDFNSYLYKSTNKGMSWTSLKSNLPAKHLVWRLVQDHVNPDLLFIGTEFGIFYSQSGGKQWHKFENVPTISFRDLTIQRRENDLVAASFGRSFFILDNISPLRQNATEVMQKDAMLFAVKDPWYYVPRSITSNQGSEPYAADNPDFGAVFTYYLKDEFKSAKSKRKKKEKEMSKNKQSIAFPGWDALDAENEEKGPEIWFTIKDDQGNTVRRMKGKSGKGLHRSAWDLRYGSKRTVPKRVNSGGGRANRWTSGPLVPIGTYTVSMSRIHDGVVTELGEPQTFTLKPLHKPTLPSKKEAASFVVYKQRVESLQTQISVMNYKMGEAEKMLSAMSIALSRSDNPSSTLEAQLASLNNEYMALDRKLFGSDAKDEIGERNNPTINSRSWIAYRGLRGTYGPTDLNMQSLEIAESEIKEVMPMVIGLSDDKIMKLAKSIRAAGAPWIEGMPLGN